MGRRSAAWLPLVTAALLFAGPGAAQDVDLTNVGFVLGSDTAPVTVVEFGDYACSACAEFHHDSWPEVKRRLVDQGVVRWRHVPFLLGFRRGEHGAKAAQCAADQGRFWSMHDRLFLRQEEWTRGDTDETLRGWAVELGLDGEAFAECYDENHARDRIRAANRAAKELGIRVTPVFYIGGEQVQGALPAAAFIELVQRARTGAGR